MLSTLMCTTNIKLWQVKVRQKKTILNDCTLVQSNKKQTNKQTIRHHIKQSVTITIAQLNKKSSNKRPKMTYIHGV